MTRTQERHIIAVALGVLFISGLCGSVVMFGDAAGVAVSQVFLKIGLAGLPIGGLTAVFALVRA